MAQRFPKEKKNKITSIIENNKTYKENKERKLKENEIESK